MLRISPRLLDWAVALSGAVMLAGLSLILRAANEGDLPNSLVSVWHIPLYVGVLLAAYAVVGSMNPAPGLTWRKRLPREYRISGIGIVLFAIGFVTDVAWQAATGSDVDVISLITPTHLLAFIGIGMVLLGPILAPPESGPSILSRAPATVCLGLLLALAGGVTQFANPLTQVLADRPSVAPLLANPAELWSMRTDGTTQTRLTRSGTEVANTQSWSADGTNTSHSSWRYVAGKDPTTAEGVTSSVVIADGAGSPVAEITGDGGWLSGAVWSPSGSDLALNVFHSAPAGSSPGAGASGQPNVGVAEPQANAAPAPAAGNVAAFTGIEWDIAIAPATAGGSPHLIDRTPATDIVTDWSPDGSSLLAHSDRGGDFDVYRIDPTSGAATDLTNSPGVDDWAAWSPDGTMIAFTSERSGGSHIWVMDANGSHPKQLTSGSWADWVPAWSPSGKQLAFLTNRDGQGEIYRMQVDGSQQVNLTQTPTRDEFMTADAWSPDGETIRFDAAATTTQGAVLSLSLAAASIIIQSVILVGVLSFAWSRRLLVPGSLTVMLGISFTALSFASGEYEFIAAGIAAGVLIDLALWGWRPPREAPAFFFAVPLIVYGAYFAALQIAGTLGWSLPMVIAFTGLAGVTGLATGLLAGSSSPPERA